MNNIINHIEMRSSNPIHYNNNDNDDDIDIINDSDENNSLITNKNNIKSNKWSLMKKTIFSIVTGIIIITIIDAIIMSLNKFVSVDVKRVDLYFKPQVFEYGDMQISVKSKTKLLSFLHSAQVKPESSSCIFNLLRDKKKYLLTKATLKSKMDIKSTNYGSNTANLDIGWSDFDYATLQDMVIDNPHYAHAELSVECGIVYDIYAFSFIPVKNNHYKFNLADTPEHLNIRDILKTIFESGNVGNTNRRLLDSFSLPMQFYNTSFLPDITNSINQFGFKASTKIDSSKANIPFQVGVHVPAFKLLLGHSFFNNLTNMNQYESPYVFESYETSFDLFNSELSNASFVAKISCNINGETCSLIYPLSSMLGSMKNGTAMATADFINDKNFISNFLGNTHKMMYKSYDDSSTAAAMSPSTRSLLESNEDFTENSRSLASKKPTARPSKKPTKTPTHRPTKLPTLHPTRLVLSTWSHYVNSFIVFDDWDLLKLSLYYTDISARLKLDIGFEHKKLVVADAQLSWMNEIPLITSSNVHVDILDGQIVAEQDLFLNELDEIITNDANLYIDSDSVFNLKMKGKYKNFNHNLSVSDSFLVQFHDIDIVISNKTIATGATDITVDAKVDGYMAIDFKLNSPNNATVFTGVEWNFDNLSPQNYFGIRSIGEFLNLNPSWDGSSYFAFDPSLGTVDDLSSYNYYFNVDGQASSEVTTVESVEKRICSVYVIVQSYYWWYWYVPDDYDYYMMEQRLYEILQEDFDITRSDVVSTDISTPYWWRSRSDFNFNVFLSTESSCMEIMSALKESSHDDYYVSYKDFIQFYYSHLRSVAIYDFDIVTKFNSLSEVRNEPFSYFSQGSGLYGADRYTRFDLVMEQNSIKIDNSTLTSFEGALSADLDSNGFLNLEFTEYNDGHFNFNSSNECSWDVSSTDGKFFMNSNGTLWSSFDWSFDGEFKYLPNEDKNDYSLNFDLSGNTLTTHQAYKPDESIHCSTSINFNSLGSRSFSNFDSDVIKTAFVSAYDDLTGIDEMEVKVTYADAIIYRWVQYSIAAVVTLPVKNELECSYINFKLDKAKLLKSLRRSGYFTSLYWLKFRPYKNYQKHEDIISNLFSISQSLSGNYYDGSSDIVLSLNHAELKINGNKYDYDGSILYDGDKIHVGIKWMDQLQSYFNLNWNFDGENDRGAISMEATTLLKNAFDIVDIASNANLTFDYTKSTYASTKFSVVSAVEGHGIDYYKNKISFGYWITDKQPLTCKWSVDGVDDRLSAYSVVELSSAFKSMVNSKFDEGDGVVSNAQFLHVKSVSISNYNDFYSIDFIITPKYNVPNFNCRSIGNYINEYALKVNDLIYYLTDDGRNLAGGYYFAYQPREYLYEDYLFTAFIDSEHTTACPKDSFENSERVMSGYQCSQCYNYWWGFYYDCYCYHTYDYYYSCDSWKYADYHEEVADTAIFNIEAESHGILVGSIADNNWICEVEEATLLVDGKKTVDAEGGFYNIPPTVEPSTAPTNSMKPSNRPTISPYLKRISPTYKPTLKPTAFPTVSPTYFPTSTPTLEGNRYGDRTVIFNFSDKLNEIDIGAHGSYHGSSNDFSLVLKEISMKIGDHVITENEIGGKVAYKIPDNGETGKIIIGSWDDNGETVIYNTTNSIEWLVKDKKFYLGLGSSFTINDINLFDTILNSSVIQSPTDLLLGVGNALSLDDSKIYDINAITQFFNYDNRPDRPTKKPTKKPTTRSPTRKPTLYKPSRYPTRKPTTRKPTLYKPSRYPSRKPTPSWIQVPHPTKQPSKVPQLSLAPSKEKVTSSTPTNIPETKTHYPTRKHRKYHKPVYSNRFPNISPSRHYLYRTHSPTRKPNH